MVQETLHFRYLKLLVNKLYLDLAKGAKWFRNMKNLNRISLNNSLDIFLSQFRHCIRILFSVQRNVSSQLRET